MTTSPTLPVTQICLMSYGWVSFIVYIYVCFKIANKMRHNYRVRTPFYEIFLLNSIGDIGQFLLMELCMRPRKYNYFGLFDGISNVYAEFTYLAMFFITASVTFCYIPMVLNRFMAFAYPLMYIEIWNTKNTILLYVFLYFMVALLTIFLKQIAGDVYFEFTKSGLILMNGNFNKIENFLMIIINTIVLLICILLFIGTAIKAKSSDATSNLKRYSLEIRLVCYCLLTTIPLLLETVRLWIYFTDSNPEHAPIISAAWFFLAETSPTLQCWTFLLMGGSLRNLIFSKPKNLATPKTKISSKTLKIGNNQIM